jgi:hypothetical protein
MMSWLEADLSATFQDWIIVFWHHPPYSKGGHDSDVELRLIEMRANAMPILDDHGVDLTLSGHSHSYERSYLIDGHYGYSDSFVEEMKVDGGNGREFGDGIYDKPARGTFPHSGTVHVVAGSAGQVSAGTLDHPAMFSSHEKHGSLVVDIDDDRLDMKFLDDNAQVVDWFSITKGPDCPSDPLDDIDHDSICGDVDNCPSLFNPLQENADLDATGDFCDICPNDSLDDLDGDTVCGDVDNCPATFNTEQTDQDLDGQGDSCDVCPTDPDDDADADSHCGDVDNCPELANSDQANADLDLLGDACDACPADPDNDMDNDAVCGEVDNCPGEGNSSQLDSDGDDRGNPCDSCPLDAADDADADGICMPDDNCPGLANPGQLDSDGDGIGDLCDPCAFDADNDFDNDLHCGNADNCPGTPNPTQVDSDTNGIGDACDQPGDFDGDGQPDAADNCPASINPGQSDSDGDGIGDKCDPDDDNDGAIDIEDCAPLERGISQTPGPVGPSLRLAKSGEVTLSWLRAVQGSGSNVYRSVGTSAQTISEDLICLEFGIPEVSVADADPPPPGKVYYYLVSGTNRCGEYGLGARTAVAACGPSHADSDGDGARDLEDNCPLDHDPAQADGDGDFVGDACDNCPAATNSDQADDDGDGQGDACEELADPDGDGVLNRVDNCPLDPNPGQEDGDGDDVGDACDGCPDDPDKLEPGQCGCGQPDTDGDQDGVAACLDCDDDDPAAFPGAAPLDSQACMRDADDDDFGDDDPQLGVSPGTDCDDDDPLMHPNSVWYADQDGDGFGNPVGPVVSCEQPAGRIGVAGDCDDTSSRTFPGAAPNDDPQACMRDTDGDDYGDINPPSGVTPGTDCDDGNGSVFPGSGC